VERAERRAEERSTRRIGKTNITRDEKRETVTVTMMKRIIADNGIHKCTARGDDKP